MPYALICGAMAILFGFLPAGAGTPPGVCIFLAFIVQPLVIMSFSSIPGFGGVVPVYAPAVGLVDGGVKANFVTIATAFDEDVDAKAYGSESMADGGEIYPAQGDVEAASVDA